MTQGTGQPLLVIGAGRHGLEVCAYASDMQIELVGAVDDHKAPGPWHLTRVIGGLRDMAAFCSQYPQIAYITAVGSNIERKRIVEAVDGLGIANLAARTLQHRSAWTGHAVDIAEGTLLAPHSLATTRVRIGRHCVLNIKASASHDCVIGDWCNLNPGATVCGDVRLGDGCYVGAGATIIDKCTVGAWTIIGAGAVVTCDLPAGVTAVGVPARIVKRQGVPVSP